MTISCCERVGWQLDELLLVELSTIRARINHRVNGDDGTIKKQTKNEEPVLVGLPLNKPSFLSFPLFGKGRGNAVGI